MSELEKLVSRMESDQLPLDELLAGYQRGQYLLDFCRERLAEVLAGADMVFVTAGEGGGTGTGAGVIAGMDWTITDKANNGITKAVANMSLGGGFSQAENDAAAAMVNAGIVLVVAAGNERTDACTRSPASALDAITVGSTDRFDNRSSFSNFGECVDVFAPGSGILSANAKNYTTPIALSGTSMASPHVAGVAALILGTSPSALPEQVASVITDLSQKGIVNGSNTIVGNRLANVPSESAVPIPSLPGAPTGLQVVNSGKGFVSFGWDAVAATTLALYQSVIQKR